MCIRDSADTMRIIILPQEVRTILPPLTNQVVNLIKNTSTVAIISGADIMFTAKSWAYDTTNYVPAFAEMCIRDRSNGNHQAFEGLFTTNEDTNQECH